MKIRSLDGLVVGHKQLLRKLAALWAAAVLWLSLSSA